MTEAKRGDLILMGRLLAATDQLMRTGCKESELSYDDDLGEMSPVEILWRAEGKWGDIRKFSAHYSYPAQAAEELLAIADHIDETKPKPTKLRLRDDLIARNAPPAMVQKAASGWYDDYESPVGDSIVQLVDDAHAAGLEDIARAAVEGEYDGTKEESEAWAASAEGRAVMEAFPPAMREKLFGEAMRPPSQPQPNRAQRRAKKRGGQ